MEEIIDTYVIAKDAITENITIEITASVIMYTVTQIADDATITYTNNCVNEAGKIAAGTDLTFTVEATEGKKVGKVEYKIGEGEAVEIGADNDVYTIAKENITGDVTILVTVEGEQTYTLSFAANDFAEIADVTVNGENATVEDGNVTVKENDTVSFKVNAAELFKVTEVRANDIIVAAEDDIYTIEKVTENTTVNIATALDESKCNILTFAVDGDKGSYTATVSGNTVSGKDLSAEKTFCVGDTELVANGTIGVGLNIASGYEVEKVEVVVGKTATEIKETDGYYNVDFADSKNATIKVYTTPVGTEAVKRVVFTNGTKHLTYNVTTNENVKLETGKKYTYTVAEGTKYIDFTVTATENYEPLVILSNGIPVEGTVATVKNGKTTYKYSVAANQLADEESITLLEYIEDKNIKVTFNEEEVQIISASIGGKQAIAEDIGTYRVPYGKDITFTVKAQDNCKITKAVTTTASGKAKNEKVKANSFTFTVKATEDSETVITSEGLYEIKVYEDGTGYQTPVKGVYNVKSENYYRIYVLYGNSGYAELKKVEVKNGKAVAASIEDIIDNGEAVGVAVSKEDAGKKLTVNITVVDGTSEKVLTTTLNVSPLIKKVTVAGVKNKKLSQTADTVKEYKLTLDPKKAVNTLAVEVTAAGENPSEDDNKAAQAVVNAEVKDGKLVITTNTTEAIADVAVVKLYDTTTSNAEQKNYVEGGTFTVSTTAPAWIKTKPSVALKSADDTSLTLTLGAKNVDTPVNGKVYYKVEVTPQTVKDVETPAAITEATAKAFYVEKTAASQMATLVVNSNESGKGQAWKYDVKVTLVQTKDKDTVLTEDNEESITAFKTAEGKEAVKKGLATKRPYYETNLKLKKGTTTVYTGQSDIVVATAQFGKNTTFTGNISAKELTGTLDVKVVDGNKIVVSADRYISTGKYTIEVTADAPSTMKAATATITVNVVQGICSLGLKTTSTTLYKPEKKAASMKATVSYDGYMEVPKTKKVTWSIVDIDGNALDPDDYLYGKVSVKNGTVTVNKNYIVSTNEEDNQFKVKVQAADFKGNETTYACSNVITITSEAAELGDVVIVKVGQKFDSETGDSYNVYKVIARSGDTVSKEELTNGNIEVHVLKKGVAEKDTYLADDFVSQKMVSFTSSNKNVIIYEDGYLSTYYIGQLTKTQKNIKITATATDGSKNKAVLDKFTINIGESKKDELIPVETELGLAVYMEDPVYYMYGASDNRIADIDTSNMEFKGTENTLFRFKVVTNWGYDDYNGEYWEEVSTDNKYCELEVKNAKVLSKSDTSASVVGIEKSATITLKYINKAGEEVVKTYTITNTASDNEAPKVKVNGTLVENCSTPQMISFDVQWGNYDYKDKFVHIEVDNERRTKGTRGGGNVTASEYINLGENVRGYIPVNDDGTIDFCVDNTVLVQAFTDYEDYKVWLTFGTVDEAGQFVADTKATSTYIRVMDKKTESLKNASFKLNTSYKMSLKEGGFIELTGKGKGIDLDTITFSNLKNANIDGTENKFRDYFELDGNVLKLKDTLTVEQIAYITGKTAKNDLTGFVSYQIDGLTGYNGTSGTVQIKVSFADTVQKFSLTNATILEDEIMTASVDTVVGKISVGVTHAYVTDGKFTAVANGSSTLTLTSQGENKATAGKNKVTLYIVPAGSYYETELTALKSAIETAEDKTAAETAYNDAVQKYGVKVTTTITVKDRASTTGKIKFNQNDLKQQFTHDTYYVNEETLKGIYYVPVPFTKTVDCKIVSIATSNELVTIEALYDEENKYNSLAIEVEKGKLEQAVSEGTIKYGDILSVTATLNFGEGTKAETVSFKLTLPKEKAMTFAEAVEAVNNAGLEELKADYQVDWTNEEILSKNKQNLEKKLQGLIYADSDAEISIEVDLSHPSAYSEGEISYEIILTNKTMAEGAEGSTESIFVYLPIAKTGSLPSDFLTKFIDYYLRFPSLSVYSYEVENAGEITNEWLAKKVVSDIKNDQYLQFQKYPSLKVEVKVSDYTLPAEGEEVGTISFTIMLYDIKNGAAESYGVTGDLYYYNYSW